MSVNVRPVPVLINGFGDKPMHDHGSTSGTPRWMKMIGFTVIVLLLLFASLHVIGRNSLGDAFGGHADHTPHAGATEHSLQ
jgi:hypothetical protein